MTDENQKRSTVYIVGGACILIILWLLFGSNQGEQQEKQQVDGKTSKGGNTYPVTKLGDFVVQQPPDIVFQNPKQTVINNVGCPCTSGLDSKMAGTFNNLMRYFARNIFDLENAYLDTIRNAMPSWVNQFVGAQSAALEAITSQETFNDIDIPTEEDMTGGWRDYTSSAGMGDYTSKVRA